MRRGEIYLASFPFSDVAGMKLRPVLLLSEPIGGIPEILTAYISSVIPARELDTDIVLDPSRTEYAATNLKSISVLRLHKLATLHVQNLARRLGKLAPPACDDVDQKLRRFLRL